MPVQNENSVGAVYRDGLQRTKFGRASRSIHVARVIEGHSARQHRRLAVGRVLAHYVVVRVCSVQGSCGVRR